MIKTRPGWIIKGGYRDCMSGTHRLTVIYLSQNISVMSPFEALAEANRRRILDVLRDGERPAGDLVDALAISQPGVSKHLKLLREAGLVSMRADGQRRVYRLERQGLSELEAWLAPYRRAWADRLDALEVHLERDQ